MPRQSVCDNPCCLHPEPEGSASGSLFFRGHLWVHFRCGPVTRSPSRGWLCQSASSASFPPRMRPKLRGADYYPGETYFPTEHVSLPWTHSFIKTSYTHNINELAPSSIGNVPEEDSSGALDNFQALYENPPSIRRFFPRGDAMSLAFPKPSALMSQRYASPCTREDRKKRSLSLREWTQVQALLSPESRPIPRQADAFCCLRFLPAWFLSLQ